MYRMFALASVLATSVWFGMYWFWFKTPVENSGLASLVYGALFSMSFLGVWWNLINFKKLQVPELFEFIRIPWTAIALGMNSAYFHLRFANPESQKTLEAVAVKNLWIGVEVALTIALIIGLHRWDARHDVETKTVS